MEQPQPFTVAIDDATLDDLKRRLANARLPEAELVDDWSRGPTPGLPEVLLAYWRTDYDWRRCETLLNSWPQFTVPLNGPAVPARALYPPPLPGAERSPAVP